MQQSEAAPGYQKALEARLLAELRGAAGEDWRKAPTRPKPGDKVMESKAVSQADRAALVTGAGSG